MPLAVTALVEPGRLTWSQLVDKLARNPARILGLDGVGTLQPGTMADVTIIDPKASWTIEPSRFQSKSSNSPFAGFAVKGRAAFGDRRRRRKSK